MLKRIRKRLGLEEARTASGWLANVLARGILHGRYPEGARLPTERHLAEEFAVSRHVVREALKRLEALGLVRIRHGSGVYVNSIALAGGVEVFEYLVFDEENNLDQKVLCDFFDFWQRLYPEVMRLAAENRTDEELAQIRAALAARSEAMNDLARLVEANQGFMAALAQATHNTVYQLVFNSISRVMNELRARGPLAALAPIMAPEDLARLVDAVAQRDGEIAALLAARMSAKSRDAIQTFFQTNAQTDAPEGPAPKTA